MRGVVGEWGGGLSEERVERRHGVLGGLFVSVRKQSRLDSHQWTPRYRI